MLVQQPDNGTHSRQARIHELARISHVMNKEMNEEVNGIDVAGDVNTVEIINGGQEVQQNTAIAICNQAPIEDVNVAGHDEMMVDEQNGGPIALVTDIRRRRGRGRQNWAVERPEIMRFNSFGQPVAPSKTVARYVRHLGQLAIDRTLFPINVPDWRKFKGRVLDSVWRTLWATIDWSNESTRALEDRIRFVAEAKMNERWKHHKCTLRADWYKPNINTNVRFVCGDPHVDPRQWSLLVAYWDSEKGQHRSAMGVINRSRSIMGHTTGTKSFAQVRDEYAQDHGGVEPNRIQMFNLTHRRANGEPVDARSEAVIVDLEQRINAFKNTAENNDAEMTNKVIDEMFVAVFGPEKHNNVRGYGIGVVPNDMPHLVREKRGLGMELQSLRVAYKEQAVEFAKKTQEQREELDLTKLALDHYMRELVRVRMEHQQMELNFDGRVSSALDKYLRSSIDGGSGSYEVGSTSSPPLSSMFPANTLPANPLPSMEDID